MKANPENSNLWFFDPVMANVLNVIEIRKTNEAELLGLTIDHKLKSDADVEKLCKTAKFKV